MLTDAAAAADVDDGTNDNNFEASCLFPFLSFAFRSNGSLLMFIYSFNNDDDNDDDSFVGDNNNGSGSLLK